MATRHVRPNNAADGGWVITITEDPASAEAHTTTQAQAVENARDSLQDQGGGTLFVHGVDGAVREERSVD